MDYIDERVLWFAKKYITTEKTIRELAKEKGVSKSTVQKDLTERLRRLNRKEYSKVQNALRKKQEIGRIRGGKTLQIKWSEIKKAKG